MRRLLLSLFFLSLSLSAATTRVEQPGPNRTANTVLAGPTGGGAAQPTFRALVEADVGTNTVNTAAIKDDNVTNAKLRNSSALSVIGRSANSTGDPADIAGTANQVLRVDSAGTTLGFGQVNVASASAVTGTLAIANGGTNSNAVLNNNRMMYSSGGAIVELGAMSNGQIIVGSTGAAPQVVTMSGHATISNTGVVTVNNTQTPQNLLVNGAMRVAQRINSAHNTFNAVAENFYGIDRWKISRENADVAAARYDTNTGGAETGITSRYYAKYQKSTGSGKIYVRQILTGAQTFGLHGRTVTFQMKMKSDTARTMRMGIIELSSLGTIDTITTPTLTSANGTDITFGTNQALCTTVVSVTNATSASNGATCSVGTTWANYAITYTISTTCKNIICGVWSDSDIGTSVGNREIYLAEAGLFDGQYVREYIPEDEETEVVRCLPFFAKSFALDTQPIQGGGAAGNYAGLIMGSQGGGAAVLTTLCGSIRFSVPMRIAPTLTFYNPSAANAFVRNFTAAADATTTAGVISDTGFYVNFTSPAGSALGQLCGVHWSAEAEF